MADDIPKLDRVRRPRNTDDENPREKPQEKAIAKETLEALKLLSSSLKATQKSRDYKNYLKYVKKETKKEKRSETNINIEEKFVNKKINKIINKAARKTKKSRDTIIKELKEKKGIYDQLDESIQALVDKTPLDRLNKSKDTKSPLKEFFGNILEKIDKTFSKHEDTIKASILGPLTLITQPFEDFLGGSLFDFMKGIFTPKKSKRNPAIGDLIKKGEDGVLFLWSKMKGFFEGKNKKKEGSGLENILGNLKGLGPMIPGLLAKGGAIAALAGGIVWAISDGIAGMNLSKEWKTSKVSGFIGGFLGGTKKGWLNAFKNAGKWALIGAGGGFLVAGPVGAIVGGLVGAAVGGLLGFIGGQKIAKSFNSLGKWFYTNIWESGFMKEIRTFVGNSMTHVFDFFKGAGKNLMDVATGKKTLLSGMEDFAIMLFKGVGNIALDFLHTTSLGKFIDQYLLQPLLNFFNGIGDFFSYLSSFKNPLEFGKAIASGGFNTGLEAYSSKKKEERQQKKKEELLNTYSTELDKEYKKQYGITYTQKKANAEKYGTSKDISALQEAGITLLTEKKYINPTEITNVNDAIIKPDGKIIRTHPDDTIVATKNDPEKIQTGNVVDTSKMESKLDKMITLLQALLEKNLTIKLPSQTSMELDNLIKGVLL